MHVFSRTSVSTDRSTVGSAVSRRTLTVSAASALSGIRAQRRSVSSRSCTRIIAPYNVHLSGRGRWLVVLSGWEQFWRHRTWLVRSLNMGVMTSMTAATSGGRDTGSRCDAPIMRLLRTRSVSRMFTRCGLKIPLQDGVQLDPADSP